MALDGLFVLGVEKYMLSIIIIMAGGGLLHVLASIVISRVVDTQGGKTTMTTVQVAALQERRYLRSMHCYPSSIYS